MEKLNPSLNRRDFLRLGSLLMGGLAISPLQRLLEQEAKRSEGKLIWAGWPATPGSYSPLPPNPLLRQLGFGDTDRVVIIEQEDLGLCEANLSAYYELLDSGLIASASAVVPSAWFPQVAHFSRTHPGADIGIALILISDWDAVRWRPLSTVEMDSGLLDNNGYFPKNGIQTSISDPQVIIRELVAQVQRAKYMDLRPTHLAMHRPYQLSPSLLTCYLQAAQDSALPLAFLRPDESQWNAQPGISREWASTSYQASTQLNLQGAPLLDSIIDLGSTPPYERLTLTRQVLDNLAAGVHLISLHAARDTPELRTLIPDWQYYVADYQNWTNPEMTAYFKDSGIQVTQWKAIQAVLPAG